MPVVNTDFSVTITGLQHGTTLLAYVSKRFPYHASCEWLKIIEQEKLLLNARPAAPEAPVTQHDELTYLVRNYHEPDVPLDYRVLHRDSGVLLVHKPAGLPVCRTGRIFFNTLINMLRRDLDNPRIGLLNRLDRETSGIVCAVEDPQKYKTYSFQNPSAHWLKLYAAVTAGAASPAAGVIREGLSTLPGSPIRCQMHFSREGKPALTCYEAIGRNGPHQLLIAAPITGRKHQLRAHLAGIGCPVTGDKIYSNQGQFYLRQLEQDLTETDYRALGARRQLLHCFYTGFYQDGKMVLEAFDWDSGRDFQPFSLQEQVRAWYGSPSGNRFLSLVLQAREDFRHDPAGNISG